MIGYLKKWLFYKEFQVVANQKHQPNSINYNSSICILFDGTNEDDRKKVHKFKKNLNTTGHKSIKSLAFIDNNLPLDNVDYSAYNRKNIKWCGVPFGEKVEEFIHLNFDVLIVLCKKMLPHYEYIIAHSQSRFIIGSAIHKAEKYFNLIVDAEEKNDLDEIIKCLLRTTEQIAIK
ncbi:MAG: hypothetical protein IPK35_06635 [Saprospiraceae bacterium]|nr:hypothetical protein [Saprospiraceae bacterium]